VGVDDVFFQFLQVRDRLLEVVKILVHLTRLNVRLCETWSCLDEQFRVNEIK
jgi:hypothetical protein